jgi:3'-phosphoadenosine 5'-phosphosulfate sulfotransferase (PAPS reductase)/FAD synthetase
MTIIKTHKNLATFIEGKRVLHLNSYGKDSLVCLEWLYRFAECEKIISLHFEAFAPHYDDARYLKYLKKQYPKVEFINEPNAIDLTNVAFSLYQSPIEIMTDLNKWEYDEFDYEKHSENIALQYLCEYICIGHSKYESVSRAVKFYNKGLVSGKNIYPLGLMTKDQVLGIIKHSKLKVHPVYKIAQSTIDYPSYYKMRSSFIVDRQYRQNVLSTYPLLVCDEYRYEKILNKKT